MKHALCTILQGDNRTTLAKLTAGTIQTAITSPPYFSVRDYNTPPVIFPRVKFAPAPGLPAITISKWEGQLGLEPDPWAFIGHLLLSFRALWPALRDDGTLWVNLGDTYHTGQAGSGAARAGENGKMRRHQAPNRIAIPGYQQKDLLGIPWMFAKAMQAEGWVLRSEIIWHKPNPMPGSQCDRPTTTHEQVFLFSKRPDYFYDNEAIKEPGIYPAGTRAAKGSEKRANSGVNSRPPEYKVYDGLREKRTVWQVATKGHDGEHAATFPPELVRPMVLAGTSAKGCCPECGAPWVRILESVELPVPADGLPEGADLFGEETVRPTYTTKKTVGWRPSCVCGADPALGMVANDLETFETPTGTQEGKDDSLARGRRGGAVSKEGTGKRLLTRYEHRKYAAQLLASPNRLDMEAMAAAANGADAFEHYTRTDDSGARPIPPDLLAEWITAGWLERVTVPTWNPPAPVPCVVLDLFAGSGTVAEVAIEEGRRAIACELAPHYIPEIETRTQVTPPLFVQ